MFIAILQCLLFELHRLQKLHMCRRVHVTPKTQTKLNFGRHFLNFQDPQHRHIVNFPREVIPRAEPALHLSENRGDYRRTRKLNANVAARRR